MASGGHGEGAVESELTESEVSRIAGHLLGTPASPEDAMIVLEIEIPAGFQIDSLEADLADCNLERCPGCEWWFESGELVDDEGELVGCPECRDE